MAAVPIPLSSLRSEFVLIVMLPAMCSLEEVSTPADGGVPIISVPLLRSASSSVLLASAMTNERVSSVASPVNANLALGVDVPIQTLPDAVANVAPAEEVTNVVDA